MRGLPARQSKRVEPRSARPRSCHCSPPPPDATVARLTVTKGAAALLISLAALLPAATARANGAFPDSQSIMTPEALPHAIRLATNFGIISSDDDGATWVWSCEQADSTNGSLYQMGPSPKNRIFTISTEGLAFSDNNSCGWSLAGGAVVGTTVLDAFPDRMNVNRVMAVAATNHDGGAPTYAVLESTDSGATFAV